MRIAFFASSADQDGAAAHYRGIARALAERGHRIVFYVPETGLPEVMPWARVITYPVDAAERIHPCIDAAKDAELIVRTSGHGVLDELLDAAVLELSGPGRRVVFWDLDTQQTLARVHGNPRDRFRELIPRYDLVLSYGGGEPIRRAYHELGARECVPVEGAVDPEAHHPVPKDRRFAGDLGLLATRRPEREEVVSRLFFEAARCLPDHSFVLGGSGWDDAALPVNVRCVGHVDPADHNAWSCSLQASLHLDRGASPATRVLEAAARGACIVTDGWRGIGALLTPGEEILVANDGEEVAALLDGTTRPERRRIAEAARRRVLRDHTFAHRAMVLEEVLDARS
jgi:spore maturation protein CgeB